MKKIATHNSGTGEKSKKWYHKLLIPFARTQKKTLEEQVLAGCTYFDIRIRENGDYRTSGSWNVSHGLWQSDCKFIEVLKQIKRSSSGKSLIYIMVTYEGDSLPFNEEYFVNDVKWWINMVNTYSIDESTLSLTEVNIKKPKWRNIYKNPNAPSYIQGYKNLDGSSWHTYLPLPWLWNKIYGDHNFDDDVYKFVDFL
jgi:hypothetical protein